MGKRDEPQQIILDISQTHSQNIEQNDPSNSSYCSLAENWERVNDYDLP